MSVTTAWIPAVVHLVDDNTGRTLCGKPTSEGWEFGDAPHERESFVCGCIPCHKAFQKRKRAEVK